MITSELLELVSTKLNISYYEIAKRLKVQPGRVYEAKKNKKTLSIEHHFMLIKMIKGDPCKIMPGIYAARATRQTEKVFFTELARRVEEKNPAFCILCKIPEVVHKAPDVIPFLQNQADFKGFQQSGANFSNNNNNIFS